MLLINRQKWTIHPFASQLTFCVLNLWGVIFYSPLLFLFRCFFFWLLFPPIDRESKRTVVSFDCFQLASSYIAAVTLSTQRHATWRSYPTSFSARLSPRLHLVAIGRMASDSTVKELNSWTKDVSSRCINVAFLSCCLFDRLKNNRSLYSRVFFTFVVFQWNYWLSILFLSKRPCLTNF